MRFELPLHLDSLVQRFADEHHLSREEAVMRLIEAGLERVPPPAVMPRHILGAFSSPEDRALMDSALELAMRDRERRGA